MSGIIAQNAANATGLIKAATAGGAWTKLATSTASASADISFASNIDSTYPIYLFEFINCHPSGSAVNFQVNFRDGSTAYDATKTTTKFEVYHKEDASATALQYATGDDLAQAAGVQRISIVGNDNDQSVSGFLYLFNPSSTTYVKHFISRTHSYYGDAFTWSEFAAGYCNVTAAIDGVQFSFSSGDIDAGTIKLYGLGDS